MNNGIDVAVAGLGVYGAAVTRALAERGARVLALDARTPPHTDGSSHGRTRILRAAYFEHPLYVPLVQRALVGWRRLETDVGRPLFRTTGAVNVGPEAGSLVRGTHASCERHHLACERLDAAALRRRFPALRPADDDVAILEPEAGVLFAEACVAALLARAAARGATIRTGEALLKWNANGRGGVTLQTTRATHHARALVLAVGSWLPDGLAGLPLPLVVERQTQHWFAGGPELAADRFPVVLWEHAPDRVFWALPDVGDGMKAGIHHDGACVASAGAVARTVTAEDERRVRDLLGSRIPAAGATRAASVCVYTNTPDGHFLIDVHPAHANVVIASACSGHGFKFAPALAEHIADLALGAPPAPELAPFGLGRFRG